MKKLLSLFIALIIAVSVSACGEDLGEYVPAPVTINLTSTTLKVNEGTQLYINCGPEGKVQWSSLNGNIAVVSESGYVTAKSIGETTIKGDYNGKEFTCSVFVKGADFTPVLEVSETQLVLFLGSTFTASAFVSLGGERVQDATVTWTPDNSGVISVTDGTIKGEKEGNGKVNVSSSYLGENLLKEISVTVYKADLFYVEQENVKLSKTVINPEDQKEIQLTCSTTVEGEKEIVWSSSDQAVATVSDEGLVTSVDKGQAVITATLKKGGENVMKAWTTVTVYKAQEGNKKQITGLKTGDNDVLKIPLSALGYTGEPNESVTATIAGKTFTGRVFGNNVEITTDGTVYGNQTFTVEVNDRTFLVGGEITAKTVAYKKNVYYRDVNTEKYVKQGETIETSASYDSNLLNLFMIDGDDYLLNTEKTGGLKLNPDGSTVFDLYYDQAVMIGGLGEKSFLHYLSDSDDLGSSKLQTVKLANYANKSNVYKVTNVERRTFIKIVGVNADYLSRRGYTKLRFNMYCENVGATNVIASLSNSAMPDGKNFSFHAANEVNDIAIVTLKNESGSKIPCTVDNKWVTVEFDLTNIRTDNKGIKSLPLIIGCEAGASFYIQGATFA